MKNGSGIAVIFDMDGVLVDTEPVIEAAAITGLAEFGVTARPADFQPFIGAGEVKYIGGVAEKYGIPYQPEMKDRVYQIYLEIVAETLKVFPGIKDCLKQLQQAQLPLALASSADRIKIEANLRVAGIPEAQFSVILGAEDVSRRKPAPDIYLKAAERLEIRPDCCIVVEDAVNGIEAARAAGMHCVAVANTFSPEILAQAKPDKIYDNSRELFSAIIEMRNGI